ncbi:methyltransferase regulatory domain-containing protein [Roseomonas sp. CCTCC AB2023176]|uniref:class I SAM-dependent methyltransferase n=1 Tax=Roseomonas sp. CCTCC AB2023176 TaxID=3342640 RepID=UPI0035E0D35D
MTSWSRGYVADAPYVVSYNHQQTPAHVAMALAVNGVDWRPRPGMTLVDIGCGRGLTTAVLAAANPTWMVIGLDYNPAHVAEATAFAEEAGLDNLRFLEADLAAMSDADLAAIPAADMMMLHGVWTWVADPVRAGIVRLLAQRLKAGGVFYCAYNALPGFGENMALQRLVRVAAAMPSRGDSVSRVLSAAPFVKRVRDAGAMHLKDTRMLKMVVGEEGNPDPAYLAHEMMTDHWRPVFFGDLFEALAPARMEHAGSATLAENFPSLVLEPEQIAIVEEVPEGPPRELVKDLFLVRPFRRDLFVRGARRADRTALLDRIVVGLSAHRADGTLPPLRTIVGKIEVPEAISRPILAALEERPRTLGELRTLPGSGRMSPEELLVVLDGTDTVLPIWNPQPDAAAVARARRFNRVLAQTFAPQGVGDTRLGLASPWIGAGLGCSPLEAALTARDDLATRAPAELAVAVAGELEGEGLAQATAVVTQTLQERLPAWRRFGVA